MQFNDRLNIYLFISWNIRFAYNSFKMFSYFYVEKDRAYTWNINFEFKTNIVLNILLFIWVDPWANTQK